MQRFKKQVVLVLFVTIIVSLVTSCTQANYTEGLEFELSEDRTYYVVTGIGKAKGSADGRFDIKIPATYDDLPVKSIGNEAFYNCIGITSVKLPDSIEIIGEMAFYGCEKLGEVTIPEKLTQIKYGTFWNCYNLKEIMIPVNIKHIEKSAFLCTGLESVTISDASIDIEEEAFSFCENLTKVDILKWDDDCNISTNAFYGCVNLKSITTPDGDIDLN